MSDHVMPIGDVAKAVQLSVARIAQLDDELQPIRLPNGHRRYSVKRIEAFVAARTKRAG